MLEWKDQIYETIRLCQAYLAHVNLSTVLLSLALIYIIFLRKSSFKTILSFFLFVLLLFVLLVRVEAFLISSFGAEDARLGIGVLQVLFFIVIGVVLLYQAAVKE